MPRVIGKNRGDQISNPFPFRTMLLPQTLEKQTFFRESGFFFAVCVALLPPGINFYQKLLSNTLVGRNGLFNFVIWCSSLRNFHDTTRVEENTLACSHHCFGAIFGLFTGSWLNGPGVAAKVTSKHGRPTKRSDSSYVAAFLACSRPSAVKME